MVRVQVAPGKFIEVDTDDESVARETVDDYLKQNPNLLGEQKTDDQAEPSEQVEPTQAEPKSEEDVNLFGDFGVGLTRGLVGATQGIAELFTSTADLVADTKYTQDVAAGFEDTKKEYNLEPKTFAGQVGEIIGNYVLPGIAAIPVGAAAGTALAVRLGVTALPKAVKGAGALFGIGLTDAVVSPSGTSSIGDVLDVGPTKTTEIKESMSGREQAAATLLNKAKIGTEAAIAAPVVGQALKLTGTAAKKGFEGLSRIAEPVVTPLAVPLQNIVEKVSKGVDEAQFSDNRFVKGLDNYILSNLRVRGKLTPETFQNVELAQAQAKTVNEELSGNLIELERELAKLQKPLLAIFSTRTKTANQDLVDQVSDALTGGSRAISEVESSIRAIEGKILRDGTSPNLERALENKKSQLIKVKETAASDAIDALPERLRAPVMSARLQVDNLSQKLLDVDSFQRNYAKKASVIADGLEKQIKTAQESGQKISDDLQKAAEIVRTESRIPSILDDKISDIENTDSIRDIVQDQMGRYLTRVYRKVEERDFLLPESELNKLSKDLSKSADMPLKEARERVEQYAREIGTDLTTKSSVDKGVAGGVLVPKVRINTGILQPRRIKDDPVPNLMSKVLGEVTDPSVRYASTVKKMGNLIASDNFYRNFVRSGLDDGTVSTVPKRSAVTNDEFVRMEGSKFGVLGTGNQGKGFFVDPEIARALQRTSFRGGTSIGGIYLNTFGRLKGASQFAKTVLSVPTQIRNFGSGPIFMMMQGNVGPGQDVLEAASLLGTTLRNNASIGPDFLAKKLSGRDLKKLFQLDESGRIQTETRDIFEDVLDSQGVKTGSRKIGEEQVPLVTQQGEEYLNAIRDVKRSQELGLLGTSVQANEIAANLERNFGAGKLYNALNKSSANILKFAENVYRSSDDLFKIAQFRAERAKYQQAFPTLSIGKIEELAAENVKNIMPTYPRVVQAAGVLRAAPLGSFVSYQAEIIRNTANTLKLGLDEIAKGKKTNNATLRRIGTQRLIGLTTALYVVPQTLYETGKLATGVSEEQMRALQASGTDAPWSKGTTKMPTKVTKKPNGDVELKFVDLSFSLPLDPLRRVVERIIREFNEGRIKEENIGKTVFDAFSGAGDELFSPFTEEAIITEGLVDLTFRGGRTKEGRTIYKDNDSMGEILAKGALHLSRTLSPTTLDLFVKPAYKPENTLNVGLEPGAINSAIKKQGGKYDKPMVLSEQLAGALTGAKEQTYSWLTGLSFSGREYSKGYRQQAPRRSSLIRAGGGQLTQERLEAEYRQSLENTYKSAQQLATDVQAARTWGVKESAIARTLKKARTPGFRSILNNKFDPPPAITRDTLKLIREQKEKLGFTVNTRRLRAIEREFTGRKLINEDAFKQPESVARRAFEGVKEFFTPSPAQSAPIERPRNRMPPPPPPPAPIQTQPPPGPRTNVNPILVPNPVTRGTFGQQ
jgi:hypothetical protein